MNYNNFRTRQAQNFQRQVVHNGSAANNRVFYKNDLFPLLEVEELVSCLQSCDFSIASFESIAKPTPAFVITIYKQIIDSFMGLSPDQLIEQQQRKSATQNNLNTLNSNNNNNNNNNNDTNVNDSTINGAALGSLTDESETLNILILNKICFNFFQDLGVNDFNIMDLYKPEYNKTRRLLSAVVNFARFREEKIHDCIQYVQTTEELMTRLREKFEESNAIAEQYGTHKSEDIFTINDQLKTHEKENQDLQEALKNLLSVQRELMDGYEEYKKTKQQVLTTLENLGFEEIELESDRDKLSKYCNMKTEEIDFMISNLQQKLHTKKETLTILENQQQELYSKMDDFNKIFNELNQIMKYIVTDIQEAHRKEEQLVAQQQQNASTCKKLETLLNSNVLAKCSILQQQIEQQTESWAQVREEQNEKYTEHEERLTLLMKQYETDIIPRTQKQRKYVFEELINGRIQELNYQIQSLKANSAARVQEVEMEYSHLSEEIRRYINEMLETL
ncbi:hypothetical protein ACO0RG_000335 [Hanseniaspora osmophila]